MNKPKKEFLSWLKEIRISAKVTQAELAKCLGVQFSQSIANIENGHAPFPFSKIKKASVLLKVDHKEFLDRWTENDHYRRGLK